MRFSAWPTAAHTWTDLRDLSRHAESVGYDGIWVMDHFMENTEVGGGNVHEGFSLLAALAAVVPRVRLGTLVAGNTYRHPAVVANQARTIDHISGGRFVLGMGAGWQRNEHEQYGIELPAVGPLLRRFEEACRVVKSLRDQEVSDLDGDFYQLTSARMDPKPMGSLPLMIGGSGEKVMAGIIARQADEWNVWGDPELFAHKSAVMTAACEREGRDPASLVRTVQARILLDDLPTGDAEGVPAVLPADGRTIGGSLEQLRDAFGRYAAAGADEFIVLDGHLGGDPARSRALWDLVITEVAPHVR